MAGSWGFIAGRSRIDRRLPSTAAVSSRRAAGTLIVPLVAVLVWGPGPAASHGSKLDFEGHTHDQQLTDEYKQQGILFSNAAVREVEPGTMPSGTKVVRCVIVGPSCPAPLTMTFTGGVDRLSLLVHHVGAIPNGEVRAVRLRAFDAGGKEILSSPATFTAWSSKDTEGLIVNSGGANAIWRADVVLDGSGQLSEVAIDDVDFYHAHPLSVAVATVSSQVLTVVPTNLAFGNVTVGETSAAVAVTVTNGGEGEVTVTGVGKGGAHPDEFEVVTDSCAYTKLAKGAACGVTLRFGPRDQGSRAATLVISSDFGTPATVTLSGTGVTARSRPAARLDNGPIDFGAAPVRRSGATRSIALTNTGKPPVRVDRVRLDPDAGDFGIIDDGCSERQVAVGQACTVAVRLSPQAADLRRSFLVVPTDAAAAPLTVELLGTGTTAGVGVLRLVPDRLRFEAVPVGDRAGRQVIVTNDGSAPFAVRGAVTTDADGAFSVEEDACSTRVLERGAGCTIRIVFAPGAGGGFTGTLVVTSSAPGSPHLVPLHGAGGTSPPVTGGPPVTLEADPPSATPGDRLTVTGTGFVGETILVWSSAHQLVLAKVPPEKASAFELELEVPDDAPAGPHHVIACDTRSSCGEAPVAVTLVLPERDIEDWLLALAVAAMVGVALAGVVLRRRGGGRAPPGRGVPPGGGRYAAPPPRRDREVRTGFTHRDRYEAELDRRKPLEPAREYHFWVELGPGAPAARGTELTAALFTFDDELLVDAGRDTGDIQLRADGSTAVIRQAGLHVSARPGDELLAKRLFFPVRTSPREGRQRLRCSLYHANALVQSWLITAEVRGGTSPRTGGGADPQERDRDFVLSRSLDPDHLTGMQPQTLSLMLNGDADTHELRFFGEGGFKASSVFGAHALDERLGDVRRVLRRVVCGVEDDGAIPGPYRYGGERDLDLLTGDLVALAIAGFRNYDVMVNRLAAEVPTTGTEEGHERLKGLLRGPTRVQVVNKDTAPAAVPAVTFYDRLLDDSTVENKTLCPAFVRALRAGAALEDTPCFLGDCPDDGNPDVVCPSGFWGFRLYLGQPQSIRNRPEGPFEVPLEASPTTPGVAVMAVSTDPELRRRPGHEEAVRELASGLEWHYADSRDETIALLRSLQPRLVYFYCHGGASRDLTYLSVGGNRDLALTPGNVRTFGMQWKVSRPLVFVNGCQTTAVGPGTPLNLVAAFVERGWAAGVIGTETTVFEPLACAFAERLFQGLLVDGATVGESVRAARLALLQAYNPLGLVYVPYVADELRVVPRRRPATAAAVSVPTAKETT